VSLRILGYRAAGTRIIPEGKPPSLRLYRRHRSGFRATSLPLNLLGPPGLKSHFFQDKDKATWRSAREPLASTNVRNDVTFRLRLGCADGAVDAFVPQCEEKQFCQRVIPAHTGSPHRGPDTQPRDQRPAFFCRLGS